MSLLILFGGGVGDGCARPPIFRVLPPTFRILRWRSLSLILILAAVWFSTGGRSAVDLGILTLSILGRRFGIYSRAGALIPRGGIIILGRRSRVCSRVESLIFWGGVCVV